MEETEFSLFSKREKIDYSEYPKIVKLLQEHKISGDISFTTINSPEHLKGKFTYINVKEKAPLFLKNKLLQPIWDFLTSKNYKVRFR